MEKYHPGYVQGWQKCSLHMNYNMLMGKHFLSNLRLEKKFLFSPAFEKTFLKVEETETTFDALGNLELWYSDNHQADKVPHFACRRFATYLSRMLYECLYLDPPMMRLKFASGNHFVCEQGIVAEVKYCADCWQGAVFNYAYGAAETNHSQGCRVFAPYCP